MSSRWNGRRARFRNVINGAACIHPASVHDPMSGRIAQDLGFEAGMFAGSTASLTVLGAPDNITLTLSEFAEQAHRIMRAADLSLMCDADHGYTGTISPDDISIRISRDGDGATNASRLVEFGSLLQSVVG